MFGIDYYSMEPSRPLVGIIQDRRRNEIQQQRKQRLPCSQPPMLGKVEADFGIVWNIQAPFRIKFSIYLLASEKPTISG